MVWVEEKAKELHIIISPCSTGHLGAQTAELCGEQGAWNFPIPSPAHSFLFCASKQLLFFFQNVIFDAWRLVQGQSHEEPLCGYLTYLCLIM